MLCRLPPVKIRTVRSSKVNSPTGIGTTSVGMGHRLAVALDFINGGLGRR